MGVTEHRVTLGNYERQQLKEAIDAKQANAYLSNVPNLMLGGAAIGLVGLLGIGGYFLWKFLNLFETTPEERAVIARLTPWKNYNPERPEDAIFGYPKDKDQLQVMLTQNKQYVQDRFNKAQAMIESYEKVPALGVMAAKLYANAREYVSTGHTKELELLSEWEIYHTQRLNQQSVNPFN